VYRQLAERLDLPVQTVREFFAELLSLMARELATRGQFEIPGLVWFMKRARGHRFGRNPATGEAITFPVPREVKAYVKKELKVAVLGSEESYLVTARPPRGARKASRIRAGGVTKKPTATKRRKPRKQEPNAEIVRVYYGTDRKPAEDGGGAFTTERGDALSVGWCDVSIPPDHRMTVVERPRITRLEFKEDPRKHFVIVKRKLQSPAEFWRSIKDGGKESALLFIHGYRVLFDDAVYRTAQLSYDLEFDGVAVLYSWTSSAKTGRYTADIANNDYTVETLKQFLTDLMKQAGVSALHVVAHSMGNRALVNALSQMAAAWKSDGLPVIENLFLTAPDVDKGWFQQIAAKMLTTAKRTTLYASSKDKALKASKALQVYPRAGDATDILIIPGLDSIDASRLQTDFLSHSYYGDHQSVVSDFHEVMRYGTAPPRFGMRGVPKAAPRYFEFKLSR
jgi:esterase/lipase superfamily enzyme/nucleoid DNA-binding protein